MPDTVHWGVCMADVAEGDVTNTRPHLGIKAEKMDTEPSVTGELGWMGTESEMRARGASEVGW